jgi:hypothetical protein
MDADALAISKPGPDAESPLVTLGFNLLNQFRIAPRIDFHPVAYFPLREGEHDLLPLPGEGSTEEHAQQPEMEPPDASSEGGAGGRSAPPGLTSQ